MKKTNILHTMWLYIRGLICGLPVQRDHDIEATLDEIMSEAHEIFREELEAISEEYESSIETHNIHTTNKRRII
jgi:hypothetical protein